MQASHDCELTRVQRRFRYTCYKAQLLLTALLLSIEQLLHNAFNPNLLQTKKEDNLDARDKFYEQLKEGATD